VYSQRLNYLYRSPGPVAGGYGARGTGARPSAGEPTDYLQGVYYALLEGRYAFDFIHEDDLTADCLDRYAAVILPNTALLSDIQCAQLRAYADRGGSLLATFETSLYDHTGAPRADFGLADVFGMRRDGPATGAFFNMSIEAAHDLTRGFGNTLWLPGGEWRVPVRASGAPVLKVVPPYPRGIPEMVYAHGRREMPYFGPRSAEPAVVLMERGRSRRVYFPGDVDRCAWRSGNTDFTLLLRNAVAWMLRDQSSLVVEGEGMAEVIGWETEPGYAIHVINYNNPNRTRGWLRRPYPVGPQKVHLRLPAGTKVSKVELLKRGTEAPHRTSGEGIEFVIPGVEDYEVAAVWRA